MATAKQVTINESQAKVLKTIVEGAKLDAKTIDKRTVKALESRGLIKVTTNKKGSFVSPSALGKKALAQPAA